RDGRRRLPGGDRVDGMLQEVRHRHRHGAGREETEEPERIAAPVPSHISPEPRHPRRSLTYARRRRKLARAAPPARANTTRRMNDGLPCAAGARERRAPGRARGHRRRRPREPQGRMMTASPARTTGARLAIRNVPAHVVRALPPRMQRRPSSTRCGSRSTTPPRVWHVHVIERTWPPRTGDAVTTCKRRRWGAVVTRDGRHVRCRGARAVTGGGGRERGARGRFL